MKTYSAKPADVTRKWYVLDAAEAPLGRIATVAARLLIGKDKPMYTSHIDCGDYVVIVNAAELVVTGKKLKDKVYYRHSQYPGGIKAEALGEALAKDPVKVIVHAVRGMLPANKLRDGRLKRLKVYAGTEHEHTPQQPEKLSIKPANTKEGK